MSVMDKAMELGGELSKTKEFLTMKEAENMMLQNKEAAEIINEFQSKQKAFQMAISQGHQLTEEQEKEFSELEKRMIDNPYIYNYFKAQQDFEKILEKVNEIIVKSIGASS